MTVQDTACPAQAGSCPQPAPALSGKAIPPTPPSGGPTPLSRRRRQEGAAGRAVLKTAATEHPTTPFTKAAADTAVGRQTGPGPGLATAPSLCVKPPLRSGVTAFGGTRLDRPSQTLLPATSGFRPDSSQGHREASLSHNGTAKRAQAMKRGSTLAQYGEGSGFNPRQCQETTETNVLTEARRWLRR